MENMRTVSIAQEGPSPCLFEECVYDTLINQEVNMMKLDAVEHLTESEKSLVERIRSDIWGH